VRAAGIRVSTVQLEVTLEGQVRSESERALAINIAEDTLVVGAAGTQKARKVEARGLTAKSP
jgi:osmotically-inducible protein OsmY